MPGVVGAVVGHNAICIMHNAVSNDDALVSPCDPACMSIHAWMDARMDAMLMPALQECQT